MIGDAFVFDGVAHPFNFDAEERLRHGRARCSPTTSTPSTQRAHPGRRDQAAARGVPEAVDASPTSARWSTTSPTPTCSWRCRCRSPTSTRTASRRGRSAPSWPSRDPDRTVFWGSVNPLEGRRALDLMERQVGEFGAKAFKFYNVRYDYGSPFPWRMDDPRVAFPVFEKAQELGVNLIGVHKGVPLGPQPIEHTQTWDMDGAAANFPDINFVIFHVGLPFIDETCWQLIRYPNLYASLAATINFLVRAPRMFAEILGKLLFWCGEDKIVYGSEAPIFHPQWALRAFMDFEIPQDLCDGYGYPQLTDQAKRKILGENLLRLHGMDVEETKAATGPPAGALSRRTDGARGDASRTPDDLRSGSGATVFAGMAASLDGFAQSASAPPVVPLVRRDGSGARTTASRSTLGARRGPR